MVKVFRREGFPNGDASETQLETIFYTEICMNVSGILHGTQSDERNLLV